MAGEVVAASRLGAIWANRRILQLLVARDLKVKYAGSLLGYLWSILEPLLMAGVYWFVFTKIFTRSVGEEPYIVFLLTALLPWQWANTTLNAMSRGLSSDVKLVRSTNLPREIWVLRTVGSKFMEFVFALPVLVVLAVINDASLSRYVVLVPLAVVLQVTFLLGCGLILTPLSVLFTDVQRLMRILLRVLFYGSPIIYGLRDVEDKLGEPMSTIYVLNPLAGILDLYRASYFPDQWAGWGVVGISAIGSCLVLALGLWVFQRLEGTVLKEL